MLHSKRAQYASYPLKFLVVLFLMVAAMALPATAKASAMASGPYDHGQRCDAYYTVHRGDTLSLIAARYGINVRHL
ncbi:MAG: LysM peptidoglycan-binding domain-containing protein, partial [Caldilineaceae bacterium]|nr:LysM peptidoglycan-binding domain-containing protein [Caldilineaceae bacterium]